jgi:CubicO group peptidase (beta-lactamase class C family)
MRRGILRWLSSLPIVAPLMACQPSAVSTFTELPGPDTPLGRQLAAARTDARLPAVAGVRVTATGELLAHAFGERQASSGDLVTENDHFHLGSNSKAITATLLAVLVERGQLTWDQTVGESFPEWSATMPPAWRTVTLRQLLTHRAGVAPFTTPEELRDLPADARAGTPAGQRLAFARWLLQRPPASRSGAFAYSNAGYALAATMAERATGEPWELLLQTRLFTPLGIPAAAVRVGWPARAGAAPWGHIETGRQWTPHAPTDARIIAIPPALAPAGDLALTMSAYGRFLQLHLRGLAGEDGLLRATTVRTLHAPDGDYAFGWAIQREGNAAIHFHEGSAGTFHAVTLLDPRRGIAVATVTNAGGDRAANAIRETADVVLRR